MTKKEKYMELCIKMRSAAHSGDLYAVTDIFNGGLGKVVSSQKLHHAFVQEFKDCARLAELVACNFVKENVCI